MTNQPSNYRARIYKHYATNFQDASTVFNEDLAWQWGRGYRYYLLNWLPVDKNAQILDLACGDGRLLYFFKHLGYLNLMGIDLSSEQVELAKQVIPNVIEADIIDWLAQCPLSFDLITGFDIIEHLQKAEALIFLDACHSALKPGGHLILQTPNAGSLWGGAVRYGDFTHEVSFTPMVLSRLLILAGFRDVDVRETGPVPWGYSTFSSVRYLLWQFLRIGLKIWNLAEIGSTGSNVLTRVFLIRGSKSL